MNTPRTLQVSLFPDFHTSRPLTSTINYPEDFQQPVTPDPGTTKEEQVAWSPATYPEGTTRRKAENVKEVSALVLDYDHGVTSHQDILDMWGAYDLCIYTSWSHDPANGEFRYRAVMPLSTPLQPHQHAKLWAWARARDPRIDRACSDPCRIYGWPIDRPQAVFIHNPGATLEGLEVPEVAQVQAPAEPSTLDAILARARQPGPPREDYEKIREGCGWMEYAHAEAPTLGEPEWYAWLSVLGRCVDGEEIARRITLETPGRKRNDRFDEAWERNISRGPATCERIQGLNEDHCKNCRLRGSITSPVQAGTHTQPLTTEDLEAIDITAPPAPDPDQEQVEGEDPEPKEVPKSKIENLTLYRDNLKTDLETLSEVEVTLRTQQLQAKQQVKALKVYGTPESQEEVLKNLAEIEGALRELKARKLAVHNNFQKANQALAKEMKAEDVPPAADPQTWTLLRRVDGVPLPSPLNLDTILRTDPVYKGKFWLDTFAIQPYFGKAPMTDTLDQRIITDVERRYNIVFKKELVSSVVPVVSEDKAVHPVKEYLESLPPWNPEAPSLVDELLFKGFGAIDVQDPTLVRRMGRNFLISMVARIYKPGCKSENMLVLMGKQRKYKSSGLRALVSPPNPYGQTWFTDAAFNPEDKDGVMIIQGQWLIEVPELEGFKGRRSTLIKGFLSREEDKIRLPYGHHTQKLKRQCTLAGTTNEDEFLMDSTGTLRFYAVRIGKADLKWITDNRDRLWAEALHRFNAGEKWWFEEDTDLDRVALNNKKFEVVHPWAEVVERYVRQTRSRKVSVTDVLVKALEIPAAQLTPDHKVKVVSILRNLGFASPENVRETVGNCRDYYWTVPESFFGGVDGEKVVSMLRGQQEK